MPREIVFVHWRARTMRSLCVLPDATMIVEAPFSKSHSREMFSVRPKQLPSSEQLTCQILRSVCAAVCVAWLLAEDMAAKMELAPFRPWDDFFPGTDRFAKPEFGDLTKWNNRVISNLMYYQTNYFAAALVVFIIVGWVLEPSTLASFN